MGFLVYGGIFQQLKKLALPAMYKGRIFVKIKNAIINFNAKNCHTLKKKKKLPVKKIAPHPWVGAALNVIKESGYFK